MLSVRSRRTGPGGDNPVERIQPGLHEVSLTLNRRGRPQLAQTFLLWQGLASADSTRFIIDAWPKNLVATDCLGFRLTAPEICHVDDHTAPIDWCSRSMVRRGPFAGAGPGCTSNRSRARRDHPSGHSRNSLARRFRWSGFRALVAGLAHGYGPGRSACERNSCHVFGGELADHSLISALLTSRCCIRRVARSRSFTEASKARSRIFPGPWLFSRPP